MSVSPCRECGGEQPPHEGVQWRRAARRRRVGGARRTREQRAGALVRDH